MICFPIGFHAVIPVSLYFLIPVFIIAAVKPGRGLELFFRDIRAIAAKLGIVFESCPRQIIMALETAEKAAKIDDRINNLSADAFDYEMIDGAYPLAMGAIDGGTLDFFAGDEAFAAGGRSSG